MGTGNIIFTSSRRAPAIVTIEISMKNLKTDPTYDLAVPLLCACSNTMYLHYRDTFSAMLNNALFINARKCKHSK